jgi:tRNA A-37 threonylcarbamoyl transferase component Bud32
MSTSDPSNAASERTTPKQPGAAADPGQVTSNDLDATFVPDQATTDGGAKDEAAKPPPKKSKSSSPKKKATRLGDFQLVKKLGQGGMGEVYLAKQISLDRKVAVKTLSKELAKKEDFVQRFLRESRAMAKLQHPNAVQVFAADSHRGIYYAAIEYIDGQSMQDWMNDLGRLSVGDALHVTLVCAQALQEAHGLNLIHRDIKPDNILVTQKGIVKVADFGLAKVIDEDVSMTQSGHGLGTPLYMAPEQARDAKNVDSRTDIYALGATLYYFLTGELPFSGTTMIELITAKEEGTFTAARKLQPDVPERLDLMIDKMLVKNPAHRYASCKELIADLSSLKLDSPSLGFIDAPDKAVRSAAVASQPAAPKPAAQPTPAPAKTKSAPEKSWFVKHANREGETIVSKMSTSQILKEIAGQMLDIKAQAKPSKAGNFLPLAQFAEFQNPMEKRLVKERANQRTQDMHQLYDRVDKDQSRRKRWRWFRSLFENTMGGVGLVLWLAFVAAIGYGLYLVIPIAYEFVNKLIFG